MIEFISEEKFLDKKGSDVIIKGIPYAEIREKSLNEKLASMAHLFESKLLDPVVYLMWDKDENGDMYFLDFQIRCVFQDKEIVPVPASHLKRLFTFEYPNCKCGTDLPPSVRYVGKPTPKKMAAWIDWLDKTSVPAVQSEHNRLVLELSKYGIDLDDVVWSPSKTTGFVKCGDIVLNIKMKKGKVSRTDVRLADNKFGMTEFKKIKNALYGV